MFLLNESGDVVILVGSDSDSTRSTLVHARADQPARLITTAGAIHEVGPGDFREVQSTSFAGGFISLQSRTTSDGRSIGLTDSGEFFFAARFTDGTSAMLRTRLSGSDCPADLDESGTVSIVDLLLYLDDFLGNRPEADRDDSGTVSVIDLLLYLDDWFDGCP